MSGKGSTNYEQSRTTQDTNTNQASTGTGAYDKSATFDPRADSMISSLSNYTNQVNQPTVNPYAQQVVDAQNKLSADEFAKRLAGVKSSGYGGGIGGDLVKQGMFTSDFTNRQGASNTQTLLDAFQKGQDNQNTVADKALNLISLLRGETGTNEQQANTDTVSRGVTKNQKTNVGVEAGFKI